VHRFQVSVSYLVVNLSHLVVNLGHLAAPGFLLPPVLKQNLKETGASDAIMTFLLPIHINASKGSKNTDLNERINKS